MASVVFPVRDVPTWTGLTCHEADWLMFGAAEFSSFAQVIIVDLVLAGDNAIIIAVAAAGLPRHQRRRVILYGVVLAAVLRIVFAILTVQLLKVPGLMLVGGLVLLWIAWKLSVEMRQAKRTQHSDAGTETGQKTIWQATMQIIVADVTMSLDNVLAVAAIARDNTVVLVVGLALSVLFMGVAASLIAGLLERHRWIAWFGILIIVWVGLTMIYEDALNILKYLGVFT